jgi:hypothetical protein
MDTYPVAIEARQPERFARVQLIVRLLILVVPSMLGISVWPFGLLYVGLPLVAAVLLTNESGERFIAVHAPPIARALGFVLELFAYLSFVTDRFPSFSGSTDADLRIRIAPRGTPALGSALQRLLTGIPSALALLLCGVLSCFVTVVAAIGVLFTARYSGALWGFQLGVLRWQARLFAYQASLIDVYPPFTLDTSPDETALPQAPLATSP